MILTIVGNYSAFVKQTELIVSYQAKFIKIVIPEVRLLEITPLMQNQSFLQKHELSIVVITVDLTPLAAHSCSFSLLPSLHHRSAVTHAAIDHIGGLVGVPT